jgi:hypothetical protein
VEDLKSVTPGLHSNAKNLKQEGCGGGVCWFGMGVPQVPAPQRIIPIDEVELGVGNIVYKDRVELRKNDAKKQEGIVDVIATILEQSCHSNDSLQVVPKALLTPSLAPSPQKRQCACMGPW